MSMCTNLKRKFSATQTSQFNQVKKFKPGAFTNSENSSSKIVSENASFEFSQSSSQAQHEKNLQVRPFSSLSHTMCTKTGHNVSTADLELEIIKNRPKFKARPMPKYPQAPIALKNNNFTVPNEFFLETSTRSRNSSIGKSESFQFTARPCPNFDKNKFEIKKEPQNFTRPEPFKLETESRHKDCREKGIFSVANSKISDESWKITEKSCKIRCEIEKNAPAQFEAKPMPNFENVFTPIFHNNYTVPVGFQLNTEKRAVEREKFENFVRDKENYKRYLKEKEAEIEADEIKNYRKTLEFKARPLQEIKPFLINRSHEELTAPKSPLLRTKLRSLNRNMSIEENHYMDIDL